MIAEQLQAARSAHWRQQQNPLLTLDEAQVWLQQHPLCLFLPRHAQLPAPAPSFVEACLGSRQAAPGAEALEQAQALLIRLVASGSVVPLNLLGTVSEQPDFLAHTDALPFVLSLRADADWKHAPQKSSGHKVSPLVLELWKAIEKDGSLTASEAREALGRELTEAAVLRGLCELWQSLRISPVFPGAGEPARWEMLRVQHRAALTTAGNTGQVTAISLLVSMYLQSVYAASADEIEIFLSPVTSRSRVREAVRGLAATRQIHSLSMDAQTYYFLEGGLPEFAGVPEAAAVEAPAAPLVERRRPLPAPRKMQATASPGARPASPGSEPIFRRAKPAAPPADKPETPASRRPAAATGGKNPERAPWKPAAKFTRRADGPGRGDGQRRPSGPKRTFAPVAKRPEDNGPQRRADAPSRGSRPPYPRPNTRDNTRDNRPGAGGPPRGDSRPPGRPPGYRPGPRTEAGKQRSPKPWALPGRKSGGPPRPPRPGGRSDTPFKPRAPRTEQGRADAGPSPYRTNRPAGSGPGYRGNDRPRTGGPTGRPTAPPRGNRAGGPRPAAGRPNAGANPPRTGPGGRTSFARRPVPGAPRGPEGGGIGKPPRPPAVPGNAPRKPGFSRPDSRPGFGPGSRPGGSRPGGSRPGGSRPRGASSKPSGGFRDRKPGRKKPEA